MKKAPAAPQVYRPQPVPRVLQPKMMLQRAPSQFTTTRNPMRNGGVVQRAEAPPPNPAAGAGQQPPPGPPQPPAPNSGGPAPKGMGKKTVLIKLSDIKHGKFWYGPPDQKKQYTIQGAFHEADYPAGSTLEFTLSALRRHATLTTGIPSQEELGLNVLAEQQQEAKAAKQKRVRDNIGTAAIVVGPSSNHHNANGDGRSEFVGQMDNAQTAAFVRQTLVLQHDQIQYVSTTNGEHRCQLRLSPTECIAFAYKKGNVRVYHVGPGG